MTGFSAWTLVELIFGIPSHISNATEWLGWIKAIPIDWQIAASAVICLCGLLLATWDRWHPKPLSARGHEEVPRLTAWCAPDGSITLLQAAFLWIGMPMQTPIPPEVQDKLGVLRNAISQGALGMLRRYEADTETFLAVLRLWAGNPTPNDTRVLPTELRRWAETIGKVPDFLLSVEPSARPNMDEQPKHGEHELS